MTAPISTARLRELLSYDRTTGTFVWRVQRGHVAAGTVAGSVSKRGYIHIPIDGKTYRGHQLAWLYVHGEWPQFGLDHRNGKGSDNRIRNLRPASQSQNVANSRRRSDNTSGFKGVTRRGDRWCARAWENGKSKWLGLFDTPEEAHAAYIAATHAMYGEFARPN